MILFKKKKDYKSSTNSTSSSLLYHFSDELAICTKFLLCYYRLLFTITSLQLATVQLMVLLFLCVHAHFFTASFFSYFFFSLSWFINTMRFNYFKPVEILPPRFFAANSFTCPPRSWYFILFCFVLILISLVFSFSLSLFICELVRQCSLWYNALLFYLSN